MDEHKAPRVQSAPAVTPELVRRKDTGEPGNGGMFGTSRLAASGLRLDIDDVADPWATGGEADTAADAGSEVLELMTLGRQVTTAVTFPDAVSSSVPQEEYEAVRAERRRAEDERIDAVRKLEQEHGSVELAVTHAGGVVARRGFEIAGITDTEVAERHEQRLQAAQQAADEAEAAFDAVMAEVNRDLQPRIDEAVRAVVRARDEGADEGRLDELLAAKTALQQQRSERWDAPAQARNAAADELRMISSGLDEETQADVRRLTDGYLAALGEVRALGGDLVVADRSKPAAVRAFQEAAAIFPTDWVDASNNRIGGKKGLGNGWAVPDRAPVVKIGRSRAHYVDVKTEQTKKRVPRESNYSEAAAARLLGEDGRSNSPYYDIRPFTQEERESDWSIPRDEQKYKVTDYEVASPYRSTPDSPPRGRGWEQWSYPDGRGTVWRRPRYRMQTVDSTSMPEITTSAAPSQVAGRSETFAVCAHELSHRMEASVPGIKRLEEDFLRRRRTDAVTGEEEKLIRLYPRSREYAYKDGFNIAYTGKVYEDGYREILSTGMDQVFGGRSGAGLGLGNSTADPDHRNFVLGLLATVGVR